MFRFERRATAKTGADLPAALRVAAEITGYVSQKHGLKMKFGAELFGAPRVHFYFDADSLDKLVQLNASLMKDSDYLGITEKAKGLWVEGSLQDTIVNLAD
jgi:hypothetical protein